MKDPSSAKNCPAPLTPAGERWRVAGLLAVAAAFPALPAAGSATTPAAGAPPNVIFILTDDQGWGDLACHGHPYAITPNIDQLAMEGTVLTDFHVNSPVCSPSRVGFMTGRYPAREGFHHITSTLAVNALRQVPDWLDPARVTVADIFRQAGYRTGHFGKWHLGKYGASPEPAAYGFDEYNTATGPGVTLPQRYGVQDSDPSILTDLAFDAAIQFIGDNRDSPFYLNVWTLLPHAPLRMTEAQRAPYADLVPDPDDPAFTPWTSEYIRAARNPAAQMQMYLAAITQIDANVGRLMQALRDHGLENNTLLVFTSDNGPEDYHIGNAGNAGLGSTGPFRGRKRSIYEGGTRVPFIAWWPGVVPDGFVNTETIASGVDFLPTVVALAGVPLEGIALEIDGEDLSDALRGVPIARDGPLFWEWFWEISGNPDYFSLPVAVRDGKWKFYTDYSGSTVELYDLGQDPSELANVAQANPDVVAQLRDRALAWVSTLPAAPLRDAVAAGADRNNLWDYTPAAYAEAVYKFTGESFRPTAVSLDGLAASAMHLEGMGAAGFSTTSPSKGYDRASGGVNFHSHEPNPGGQGTPYCSFILAPEEGRALRLNGFSFGARTLAAPEVPGGIGPTGYEVRTSLDNFSAPVAAGALNTAENGTDHWHWYEINEIGMKAPLGVEVEIRLHLTGAQSGSQEGAFRLDDVTIAAAAVPANSIVYAFSGATLYPTDTTATGLLGSPMGFLNVAATGFSTVQASQGYAGASASHNFYTSEPLPAGAAGPPCYSFTVTPAAGRAVRLSGLAFGARTLAYPVLDPGPGPTGYEWRTSADGFAAPVAQGAFMLEAGGANYWYFYHSPGLDVTGAPDAPLELRLFLLGATAGSRGGAFRIDDVILHVAAVSRELLEFISSPLEIRIVKGQDIQLAFPSSTGLTYQLEISSDGMRSWHPHGDPVSGTGAIIMLAPETAAPGPAGSVFFRLRAED